jgi:hypothetical protein
MIPTYMAIGNLVMKRDGFTEMTASEQKLYILKQYCSNLEDKTWQDKDIKHVGRMLVLNIYTTSVNPSCFFDTADELTSDKSTELLVFDKYAPNDPSIFSSHNNLKQILTFNIQKYVEENENKIEWTNSGKLDSFKNFLKSINNFYVEQDGHRYLNPDFLREDQKEQFPDIRTEPKLINESDSNKYIKVLGDCTSKYFAKTCPSLVTEKQSFSIKINESYLHQSDYKECYIDVIFYYVFRRLFTAKKIEACCHICSKKSLTVNDVNLKQKFYGTTNGLFFDGLKNNKTYYSFTACETCYKALAVGSKFVMERLKSRLLGLSCYVLPEIGIRNENDYGAIDPQLLHTIVTVIRQSNHSKRESISQLEKLLTKVKRFELFFFKKTPGKEEFNIQAYFKEINISNLIEKSINTITLSDFYGLYKLTKYGVDLSFEGLRYLILPSAESHKNLDKKYYNAIFKLLLSTLEVYLYNRSFNYHKLLSQFVDIWVRIHHNQDSNEKDYLKHAINPFIMLLYLCHLNEFNQLEGVTIMPFSDTIVKLKDDDLTSFFTMHSYIYQHNRYARGLFIMGEYVANIEAKQREKEINSTFINRLNLSGIPVQKIQTVMGSVDEMRKVWSTYNDPITDAYYRECMHGIENAALLPAEVVFYILSGRAFSIYLAITKSKANMQGAVK